MDGTKTRQTWPWAILLFLLTLPSATAVAGSNPVPVFNRPCPQHWTKAYCDTTETFVSHWKNDLVIKASLSMSDFNDWAGGGVDATTWFVGANGLFRRLSRDRDWSTRVVLDYGEVKTGEQPSRKNMDKIFVESVLQVANTSLLMPFLAITAQSQFALGYNYDLDPGNAVSGFTDPLILSQAGGLGYLISPGFQTRFGAAMRETFTNDFPSHSDNPRTSLVENRRTEGGFNAITNVDKKINGTVVVRSRLEMFLGFDTLDQLNVDWDNEISVKAWGALGVNYRFQLRYNDEIFSGIQTRQILGVGLNLDMI